MKRLEATASIFFLILLRFIHAEIELKTNAFIHHTYITSSIFINMNFLIIIFFKKINRLVSDQKNFRPQILCFLALSLEY